MHIEILHFSLRADRQAVRDSSLWQVLTVRPCVFILGTRAQLVKIAPVLQIASRSRLNHQIWFTGQHRESIDDLLRDFDLGSCVEIGRKHKERSSIAQLAIWLPSTFVSCYRFVRSQKKQGGGAPLVIVHGDTLSTFIGALAGRLAGADIVHLESGLSSGRLFNPFPEELLRRLTFRLTRYALCPNDDACARMRRFRNCEVIDTGENTLLDCVRFALRDASVPNGSQDGDYFVTSSHRFDNIYSKARIERIVDEMIEIARFGAVKFVLHPPTVRRLRRYKLWDRLAGAPNVQLIPRMPYTDFLALINGARGVFSDGGSNQEELSYLGVPTLLYRDCSERPDGLGENIMLRSSITQSLTSYISSGKFDSLRRATKIEADVQPSEISMAAIMRWAT